MNRVILMGRVCKDVDARGDGNNMVARYSLAVDRRFKNKDGEYDTDFINIVAFGKSAEFASKYFAKGTKVVIAGRIQTGSYTNKDGQKVYTTDVVAEDQEFAESKKSSGGETETSGQKTKEVSSDDDFMNIDPSLTEELPW